MALLGSAAVAMWWNIAAPVREEFEDWHSHEHLPERMSIPGFRRGSRWTDVAGGEGFFVLYEIEEYQTLSSPGYLTRLNNPTPWSTQMMPHHRNMVRSQCRVLESFGGGIGRYMLTLRLSPAPGRNDALRREIGSRLRSISGKPGLTGGHLLRTDTPALSQTTEQRIRGGDAVADWIVLVSGYDTDSISQVSEEALAGAALVGAGAESAPLTARYRLSHSMSEIDVGHQRQA